MTIKTHLTVFLSVWLLTLMLVSPKPDTVSEWLYGSIICLIAPLVVSVFLFAATITDRPNKNAAGTNQRR